MSPLSRFSTRTKVITGVTAVAGAGLLGVAGLNAAATADSAGQPAGTTAVQPPAGQGSGDKVPGGKVPGDNVPGDNGDVKVHRSATSADDPRNEPKVCKFYLVGFNFDAGQQVSWKIRSWPPTGDRTVVSDGTLTLDADGHGRTPDMGLPDGHYKLFWNFDGEHGKAKHKVFWVKCAPGKPNPPEQPKPSETPTPAPTPSPTTPPAAPQPNPVETDFPVTG